MVEKDERKGRMELASRCVASKKIKQVKRSAKDNCVECRKGISWDELTSRIVSSKKMRREVSWNQSGKKKRLQEGGKQERRKTEPRERAKGVVKKAAGAEGKKNK